MTEELFAGGDQYLQYLGMGGLIHPRFRTSFAPPLLGWQRGFSGTRGCRWINRVAPIELLVASRLVPDILLRLLWREKARLVTLLEAVVSNMASLDGGNCSFGAKEAFKQ